LTAGIVVLTVVREDFTRKKLQGRFWRAVVPDFSVFARSKELPVLIILVAVIQVANSSIVPILPLFIQSLTPAAAMIGTTAGIIIGIRAFSAAGSAALIGRISDRLGFKRVLMVCLAGGLLSHVFLLLVSNTTQLLFLRLFAGLFLGGTIPSVNALIAVKAEEGSHGTVYGLSSSMSAAGFAAGPAIGASVAAIAGFSPVFVIISAFLATAFAMSGIFVKRYKEEDTSAR
jgi:MFS family permease